MKTKLTLLITILSICVSLNSLAYSPAATALGNERNYSIVSPNPAQNITTIKFYNPTEETHQIELYDVIGNKITTYRHIEQDKYTLDVTDLDAGVYFYFILKNNERVSTGRLIVKH